ncbi:hypothetical protein NHQ30_005312 [Ciborinia camelliae]|nr:hypothetical protein NHQ30_005312 [Ciborinia camelliae]
MGNAHIWIGRVILPGAWTNVIAGLDLSDHMINLKFGFAIVSAFNTFGLSFTIYRYAICKPPGTNLKIPWVKVTKGDEWVDGGMANSGSYFALDDEDDDDESSEQ